MRAVVQRVDRASVTVDEKITGEVQKGLLVLLGVAEGDTDKDLAYIIDKVCGMRIFEDEAGKMNLSVKDVGGAILAVSQLLCAVTAATASARPLRRRRHLMWPTLIMSALLTAAARQACR